MQKMKTRSLVYLSSFVSGMAVMAVEMTASRWLAPYFGSSLFVWTNVIGLVMAALALGYYFGGRLADDNGTHEAYFLLFIFSGVWMLILPFVATFFVQYLTGLFLSLSSLVVLGSFFAILALFVFPMFLWGMILPYSVKLVTPKLNELGKDAGRVSALSTLGSLLGTFAPAFVLVPYLGTELTFIAMGAVLLVLGVWGLPKAWPSLILAFLAPLLYLGMSHLYEEDVLASVESAYQRVFLKEHEGQIELYLDDAFGVQSIYNPNSVLGEEYYSYFSPLPEINQAENTLILGHAGGSFSRIFSYYYPEMKIMGVELDPAVTTLARQYMELSDSVDVVHGDARQFLQTSDELFDLIVLDAYDVLSIPPHLATVEFFKSVQQSLNVEGIFAVNVLAEEGVFFHELLNTMAQVFGEIEYVKVPGTYNTLVMVNAPLDDLGLLDEDLKPYFEYLQNESKNWAYDPSLKIYDDEHLSLVELRTQAMMMDVYGDF